MAAPGGAVETDYEVLERLGEGAFGKVYKARHRKSGDLVAVKQIKVGFRSWDEVCRSTELQALKALRHPFIVRLRELMRSQLDGSTYYIFEYIDSDLCRVVKQHPQGLDEARAADLTRQLFAALAHIHTQGFFHRDIKPENILLDSASSTLRLADFGEARSHRARPPFTDYVGTRWYRAPECLLRDRAYSSPVDVWASGLVLAELLRGSPVFCGSSSIDQLYKIISVCGDPYQDWPEFARLAGELRFRAPDEGGLGWSRILPRASPTAVGHVAEILVLNPRRRLPARRVLDSSFYAELPPLDLPEHLAEEMNHRGSVLARPSAVGSSSAGSAYEERPRSYGRHRQNVQQPCPEQRPVAAGPDPVGGSLGGTPTANVGSPCVVGSRPPAISSQPTPTAASQAGSVGLPAVMELHGCDLVEEGTLHLEALTSQTPDIDLDAELDKILGTVTPRTSLTPKAAQDSLSLGASYGIYLEGSHDACDTSTGLPAAPNWINGQEVAGEDLRIGPVGLSLGVDASGIEPSGS